MCVYKTVPYFFGGTEYFEDRLGGISNLLGTFSNIRQAP